ncbi:exonuclease domain-containing protein [Nibribacter koreensis]|uniref:Exonuclease domain-containing protein n=1 Tax=Nibribacter koreensis TaxID=1084519 RepID=A0ABP8FSL9_9BACT
MDFIALDFETATADRDSPCEIGLTYVKEGQVVDTESWLIKPRSFPYFAPFNVSIHGITPQDVADEPEFHDLWEVLRPRLENNLIVAHNAGFDLSVLRRTLASYSIPFPSLDYACSYIMSRKAWPGLASYNLKSLCSQHSIRPGHHRAAADSRACAELTLKILGQTQTSCVRECSSKLRTSIGRLLDGGYTPSEAKRDYSGRGFNPIIGDTSKHNPESIFFGRSVVFTGALSSMTRAAAQQVIVDIGGANHFGVRKDTDYLVVGQQDFRVVGEDGMSGKQEKAVSLIARGAPLEILSERDFLCNI